MGETIEFECAECGADGRIDSTSLNFIVSATELTRGEALLCDKHLSETVGGVTFDLGIGSGHTGDDEFENQQYERAARKNAEEIESAQASTEIVIGPLYDDGDERRLDVDMPPVAKHHLKQTKRSVTGYDYRHDRSSWTIDGTQAAADATAELLRNTGWDVTIAADDLPTS